MELEKYERIKSMLHLWEIDLDKGTVKTNRGEVRRKDAKGYFEMHTHYEGKNYYFKVHQIIAVAGGLDVVGKDIDHIDGCKLNNSIHNLEAVEHMENVYRAITQGQTPMYSTAKLNGNAACVIKTLLKYNLMTSKEIAERFNVSPTCIRDIKRGSTWKDNQPLDLDSLFN